MKRQEILSKILTNQAKYRQKQIGQALFNPLFKNWQDLSILDKVLRQKLQESLPYLSLSEVKILVSPTDGSKKAILKLADGNLIETVLMNNSRGQFTICLSSQVGCAMGCRFCATGSMGLNRNLSADEIIDQVRFWLYYLGPSNDDKNKITNIVIMGMGEPMANYEEIKEALNEVLKFTDIGKTHITVSTVGIFPVLENLLADKNWPNVRLAISLHAPNYLARKKIVPSTPPSYYKDLIKWSKEYLKKFGNRSHYLSFEYILISGFNDSLNDAKELSLLIKKIGQVKVNLIPCDDATDLGLKKSSDQSIRNFSEYLIKNGIRSTIRQSQGQDIAAACGQLITQEKKLSQGRESR